MTDEKKKELFPYFAWLFSKQLDPKKYGEIETYEDWAKEIDKSPEDVTKITEAAAQLTDEQWEGIDADYQKQITQPEEVPMAKEGAKLANLKRLKSYKKGKAIRKCACGCDLVTTKEKGGKISTKCSCGCKLNK